MAIRMITVRRSALDPRRGVLTLAGRSIPVAIGRGGVKANKWEGDGATPRGIFRPFRIWWRADRHIRPRTGLPVRIIRPEDGWCEDPASRHYNKPVKLSDDSTADRLTRADHLYDFIVEIDQNARPAIPRRGSAVFLHLARLGFGPTAGCIAMTRRSMLYLLARLDPKTRIRID